MEVLDYHTPQRRRSPAQLLRDLWRHQRVGAISLLFLPVAIIVPVALSQVIPQGRHPWMPFAVVIIAFVGCCVGACGLVVDRTKFLALCGLFFNGALTGSCLLILPVAYIDR